MTSAISTAAGDGVMLGIFLDVGHRSIGWAVATMTRPVTFAGCGSVLFPTDDCLASKRRANRRQRRHVRATRQRIARMRELLAHVEVLSAAELDSPGGASPWKLAAEVLANGRILTWRELWDVLRWYAHNRGYDDNALWGRASESEADAKETRDSLQQAESLMAEHGTATMAETFCAVLGVTPGGARSASHVRFKKAKASFPRAVVHGEVLRILRAHQGLLPKLDDALLLAIAGEAAKHPDAWAAVQCPAIHPPKRYRGGLLFGQLLPRFDNRIIGKCAVSGENRPLKSCPEFLEYRWAMFLANIRVRSAEDLDMRPLTGAERRKLTHALREAGYFTEKPLQKAVCDAARATDDNVHDLLLHPDAEQALILYPALHEACSGHVAPVIETLPPDIRKRVLKRLGKGKSIRLGEIRAWLPDAAAFDRELAKMAAKRKGKKKDSDPLAYTLKAEFPSGRAPYSRTVMRQTVQEVMAGADPRSEGGVLYMASRALSLRPDAVDAETNNHLLRHRLRTLRRVVDDIVAEYAGGDKDLIDRITVEVNRDVTSLSGLDVKSVSRDLLRRLSTHKDAVEYAAKELDLPSHKIGGALIRKVRIAMDLNWTCPYTLAKYDIHQLRNGSVDLDHIIPRSKREIDALDALVITFKPVNAWKSNRTAMEFVRAHAGEPVPGMPEKTIVSPANYAKFVAELKAKRYPHRDDQKRRDLRCKRMLTEHGDKEADKGFTPRDLTVTSHLAKLASAVLREGFETCAQPPVIRSIPGRITKEVRIGYELLGLLAPVNPLVLNKDGDLKMKTEIREISHLHHAVDAVTLGLASTVIPVDGGVWGAMLKRRPGDAERAALERTGAFAFDAQGRAHLRPLDEETRASIARCLLERRVVTHLPKGKHGAMIEQLTWGIVAVEDGRVHLRQRSRDPVTGKIALKTTDESVKKVLGVAPRGTSKLKPLKGALIISDNYGVALDPAPEVIPYHHVWRRIGEIKRKNGGKMPRILRNGMIIRVPKGRYAGTWKIFSTKDAKVGILVDMGLSDAVKLTNKTPGHCINILLKTLLKDGLEICATRYTGVPDDGAPCD